MPVPENAVVCFQDNLTAATPHKRSLFREAEEWILDDDKFYLFSFDNICEVWLSIRTMCDGVDPVEGDGSERAGSEASAPAVGELVTTDFLRHVIPARLRRLSYRLGENGAE